MRRLEVCIFDLRRLLRTHPRLRLHRTAKLAIMLIRQRWESRGAWCRNRADRSGPVCRGVSACDEVGDSPWVSGLGVGWIGRGGGEDFREDFGEAAICDA